MSTAGDLRPHRVPGDADLVRARLSLGAWELTVCSDGTYLLDGGAMFGVVPKTLWSQRTPADAQNRIVLGLNTVIVRTGTAVVVIETGIGNKLSPKLREIHGNQQLLPESFKAASVSKRDVTHVVNTHLHFDHCGWNTILQDDGSFIPTFPNARYFCAAGELAHGRLQLERDRVSYLAANYDPVIASGQTSMAEAGSPRTIRAWPRRGSALRCRLCLYRPWRRSCPVSGSSAFLGTRQTCLRCISRTAGSMPATSAT